MTAKHVALLSLLVAWMTAPLWSQGVSRTFLSRYNIPDMQTGLSLARTSDGGFVATGQHFNNGSYGECDVFVYRVDECGNRLWFNLYGTAASEGGKSILALSDGGFLVTGARVELMGGTEAGEGGDGMIMRMDYDGNVLWDHLYEGLQWVFEAREVPGGFVVVGNDGDNPVVMGLTDAGDVQWATTMTGMAEMALALDILPGGDIVFATNDVLSEHDLEIARLTPDGQPLWVNGYGEGYSLGSNQHIQWGCDLLFDGLGHLYAIAPTQDTEIGGKDIAMVKLDASNGDMLWSRGIGSADDDTGRQLVLAGDGIGLVGSSLGYDALAVDDPETLTEDLLEENVLLAKLGPQGYVEWARIYGGADRERGVGVLFDEGLGYTVAAFTASPVFGVTDGQMDPFFIRTDLDGSVGCQSAEVTLVSYPFTYGSTALDLAGVSSTSVTVTDAAFVMTPYAPWDQHQCEVCFNVPDCEPEAPGVCLGDSIAFVNESEIGLTCDQEWVISGPDLSVSLIFPADGVESPALLPTLPGEYRAILRSTCPDVPAADTALVFVSLIEPLPPTVSNYNGFGVSCAGSNDGWAIGQAAGGYVPGGQYSWQWSTEAGQAVPADSLPAGWLTGVVTDQAGCADSITVELTEPQTLTLETQVASNYGGYDVSCADAADGAIQALPSGGVPGYGFEGNWADWLVDTVETGTPGLFAVVVEDANGCLVADTLLLTAPEPPSLLLTATLDSCGRDVGTVTAACFGDVMPLQILWPDPQAEVVELGVDSLRWENAPGGPYAIGVEDGNGCITMDTILVPLSEADSVFFTWFPAKVCYPGAEVTFEDETEAGILSRTWDFGDGHTRTVSAVTPEEATTEYEFRAPGSFQVTLEITNQVGCTSQATEVIEILEGVQVFVPSAFTPDNDGINDGFGPVLSGVSEFRWTVFDRWGVPVFQSSDPDWWWNGSPDNAGRSHMNELFTWRLEAQGQCNAVRVYHGQIQLIR